MLVTDPGAFWLPLEGEQGQELHDGLPYAVEVFLLPFSWWNADFAFPELS
jgi:hypothetical protein